MLSTIFIWVYIAFVTLAFGRITMIFYMRLVRSEKLVSTDLEVVSIVGLVVFTAICGYISLFHAIDGWIHMSVIPICIGIWVWHWGFFKGIGKEWSRTLFNLPAMGSILIFIVLILLQSVKHPFWIDVGGYHAQSIQWIEKFGTVKGLANLHDRFGYNNGCHLSMAYFNMSFIGFPIYQAISTYLIAIFYVWVFRMWFVKKINQELVQLVVSGSTILLMVYYRDWISSPAPDLVCTVYILLVGIWFISSKDEKDLEFEFAILVVGAGVVSVKISALPIVLILLAYILIHRKWFSFGKVIVWLGLSLVIVLPQLFRNYFLSGYLLFPFASLDLFNPDWKVPAVYVEARSYDIYNFTRCLGGVYHKIEGLTIQHWFGKWFRLLEIYNKAILIIISTTPIWVVLYGFRNQKKWEREDTLTVLSVAALYVALLYWFLQAPSFRFAHGFIILCLMQTIYILILLVLHDKWYISLCAKGLMALTLVFGIYSTKVEYNELEKNWINAVSIQPTAYKKEYCETVIIPPNLEIKVPTDSNNCWNDPLPCSAAPLPHIVMRGQKLEDGFKMVEPKKRFD